MGAVLEPGRDPFTAAWGFYPLAGLAGGLPEGSQAGENAHPTLVPFDQQPAVFSYVRGQDPSRWRFSLPGWAGLRYRDVYPGLDLVFTASGAQWVGSAPFSSNVSPLDKGGRGDSVLSPSAYTPPDLLASTYLGGSGDDLIHGMVFDGLGSLYVVGQTASTNFPVGPASPPYGTNGDAFVARFSADLKTLTAAVFLGGSGVDMARDVVVDTHGVYVTGNTSSSNFPCTTSSFQTTFGGGVDDVFLTELPLDLQGAPLYSTYIGGAATDEPRAMALSSPQQIFITGTTTSADFPVTYTKAYQNQLKGTANAFILQFNLAEGGVSDPLHYSSYLGGTGEDVGRAVSLDGVNVYVGGYTSSTDFPMVAGSNPYDVTFNGGVDGFLVKMNLGAYGGGSLLYSTYLGGSKDDRIVSLDVDAGIIFLTGTTNSDTDFPTTPDVYQATYGGGINDCFIARLTPGIVTMDYATYLGGGGDDGCRSIIAREGKAFVAGSTSSAGFLGFQPEGHDIFLIRLNVAGAGLIYGQMIGGSGEDQPLRLILAPSGSLYLSGSTSSTNFPTSPGAYSRTYHGGTTDGFISQIQGLQRSIYLPNIRR